MQIPCIVVNLDLVINTGLIPKPKKGQNLPGSYLKSRNSSRAWNPFHSCIPLWGIKRVPYLPHFTIRDTITNFGKGTTSLKMRDANLWALSTILSWWSKIPGKTLRKGNDISLSTTFAILYIRRLPQQLNSNFSLWKLLEDCVSFLNNC